MLDRDDAIVTQTLPIQRPWQPKQELLPVLFTVNNNQLSEVVAAVQEEKGKSRSGQRCTTSFDVHACQMDEVGGGDLRQVADFGGTFAAEPNAPKATARIRVLALSDSESFAWPDLAGWGV